MNKIFFITFVACSMVLSLNVYAQGEKKHPHFDKAAFLAQRGAFITAEMGLTPEEAAAFIPLCNELELDPSHLLDVVEDSLLRI